MSRELDSEPDIIRFKALNRRLFISATVVIAAIAAVILVTVVVILSGRVKSSMVLVRLILTWSPCPFYLWALWTVRSLFGQLSRGGPSVPLSVTKALSRIGWALLLGATLTLILTPVIDRFSQPHRMGNFAVFDVPALTLGIVGLALLIVGNMLRRAIRIEAEAKALKDVLEGFV